MLSLGDESKPVNASSGLPSSLNRATSSSMTDKTKTIAQIFEAQRARVAERRINFTYAQRKAALDAFREKLLAEEAAIRSAMAAEFGKPAVEVSLTEVLPVLVELNHTRRHLRRWMRPTRAASGLAFLGTSTKVHPTPKGVGLIIAPWNFPFTLTLGPIVSAIAAGCSVIVKPSELTPHCSTLMERMMAEIFPADLVSFVLGGPEVAQELLALPFDHIFFTGSTRVGQIVMAEAAKTLTSVTLELGGRSPVVIGPDANIRDAARWVAWGRFMNAGQACVAADHVYVHQAVEKIFLTALRQVMAKMYGKGDAQPSDLAQIAHIAHFDRLEAMLEDARQKGAVVLAGGQTDRAERRIAPTVLTQVTDDMEVMRSEIFGPILPVTTFDDRTALIARLQRSPHPLTLYAFGKEAFCDEITAATQSGVVGQNICVMPFAHPSAPFGGIGASGMGGAHGYAGFAAFSHMRPVIKRRVFPFQIMFPPYTARSERLVRLLKWIVGR